MTTGGTIAADAGALTVRAHITNAANGTTPVVYNDAAYASICTLPVDIAATTKTFHITANGSYLVTLTQAGATIYSSVQSVTGGGAVAVDAAAEADPGYVLNDLADVSGTPSAGDTLTYVTDGWEPVDPTDAIDDAINTALTGDFADAITNAVTGISLDDLVKVTDPGTQELGAWLASDASGNWAPVNPAVPEADIGVFTSTAVTGEDTITQANFTALRTDALSVQTTVNNLLAKLRALNIIATAP